LTVLLKTSVTVRGVSFFAWAEAPAARTSVQITKQKLVFIIFVFFMMPP
jgi:hypothetical protein